MRVLVLGGSHFVGRAVAEVALDRGHHVTTCNRGISGHHVAGAELLRVDRTDHAAFAGALAGHTWDAVVDTWSGAPIHVSTAARLLGAKVGHYGYVSSRSVYTWPIMVGLDETHQVVDADANDTTDTDYAKAKRGSELGVLDAKPEALIARAGLILGPYEDVGRLPWWLLRLKRGGDVLAPGPEEMPLQYIDARDLARWMVSSAERNVGGVMNAVGPAGHTTTGELLEVARATVHSAATLVWVTPEEIAAAGIAPWTELPIWVPPTGELAGLHNCDVSAATRAGLQCRPIHETIADTWAWLEAEGSPQQREDRPAHGLDPQREDAVIAAHRSAYDGRE